jgi:hypothetical protein
MRRYLIVAAVAGGLLVGGAPAYADVNPAPNGGPLGGILDPAGGLSLDNPLGDAPLIGVKPGTNTPELPSLPGTGAQQPAEGGLPAARTGLGGAKPATGQAPAADAAGAADVAGGSPLGSVSDDNFAVANLPVGSMLSGGGLSSLGLMPDGSPALATRPAAPATGASAANATNAKAQESGLLGSGVPLLGGLGGLLPEPARTLPADVPDTTGMPAGGTAVDAQDKPADDPQTPGNQPGTPADKPAGQDATAPDPSGPGDDDKRLHEEPTDGEAANGRAFSEGRPTAGQDPDFD